MHCNITQATTVKGYKGYKDGLQPESLADGNWLVKQNQPVSKIETKSDTNLKQQQSRIGSGCYGTQPP